MKDEKIKLLIADDHAILRHGLRRILEAEPDMSVIGEAATGIDAVKRTKLLKPDVVINCAAYNFVDKAESEPDTAFAVNYLGVRSLARTCAKLDCTLVHFSTDYVFGADPWRHSAYRVSDLPGPVSVYGMSKLAGEYFVRAASPRHYVLRTAGIYGHHPCRGKAGLNFVELMLRLAASRNPIRVVEDHVASPTYAEDIVVRIVARRPPPPKPRAEVEADELREAERRLVVAMDHRGLVPQARAEGTGFFYLADTAWELFHRLDRAEAELYLKDRAAKRFTVIQAPGWCAWRTAISRSLRFVSGPFPTSKLASALTTASAAAEEGDSMRMRIRATLGGSAPLAHRSTTAWRIGGTVSAIADEGALDVDALDRIPLIFVRLAAAQEMELARSLRDRRLNGMQEQERARAFILMLGIEAGEIAELAVTVGVKNTGAKAGKEVVQLYVSDLYRSFTPPNRELKGFQKIELQPGETRTVSFRLKPPDLAFVGLDNRWITEPGRFRARVARLSQEFTLE